MSKQERIVALYERLKRHPHLHARVWLDGRTLVFYTDTVKAELAVNDGGMFYASVIDYTAGSKRIYVGPAEDELEPVLHRLNVFIRTSTGTSPEYLVSLAHAELETKMGL